MKTGSHTRTTLDFPQTPSVAPVPALWRITGRIPLVLRTQRRSARMHKRRAQKFVRLTASR